MHSNCYLYLTHLVAGHILLFLFEVRTNLNVLALEYNNREILNYLFHSNKYIYQALLLTVVSLNNYNCHIKQDAYYVGFKSSHTQMICDRIC